MFSENAKYLQKIFNKHGFQIRAVGGCVRDSLLNVKPKDYDFCTDAFPDEMTQLFDKENVRYILTGIEHGTITVVINKEVFEITSLRTDVETDGRHATVRFIRDFKHDAERRDFTINAMSMDFDGKLYDYFNGQEDLKNRFIRFVGNPEARIQEDYLRILRYFRFYSRFIPEGPRVKWEDDANIQAIVKHKSGLNQISGERIWLEISKILVSPYMISAVHAMYFTGVEEEIGIPCSGGGVSKAEIVRQKTNNPITMLSMMVDKRLFEKIVNRYKLSIAERNLGFFIISNKDIKHNEKSLKDLLVDNINPIMVNELSKIFDIDLTGWDIPKFPVSGDDVMNKWGIPACPEVGQIMKTLKTDWKESGYTLTKEELFDNQLKVLQILRDLHQKWKESGCTLTKDELLKS